MTIDLRSIKKMINPPACWAADWLKTQRWGWRAFVRAPGHSRNLPRDGSGKSGGWPASFQPARRGREWPRARKLSNWVCNGIARAAQRETPWPAKSHSDRPEPCRSKCIELDSTFGTLVLQQSRFPQRCQNVSFNLGETPAGDLRTRHEHHLHGTRELSLMEAESLSQQPPRPTPRHRIANPARCDGSQPARFPRRCAEPVDNDPTSAQPPALEPQPRKIAAALQARTPAKRKTPLSPARHAPANLTPASNVCAPPGGGCAKWLARSCWNCGSKTRAAACGVFSTADIVAS